MGLAAALNAVAEELLPALGVMPPLLSLFEPVPPVTAIVLAGETAKLKLQLKVPVGASDGLVGEHVAVVPLGSAAKLVTAQNAPTAAPGPLFVHVTVHDICAPVGPLMAVQLVVDTMSALCAAKLFPVEPAFGTVSVIVPLAVLPVAPPVCAVPPVPSVLYAFV
jgi:hypothetical protein